MGHIHADIKLTNYFTGKSIAVRALVDTGATDLYITSEMARELGFDPDEVGRRYVTLADGSRAYVPRAMGVQIHFEDRGYLSEALVMGPQCLIGVVPLEVMDLVIDPKLQRLVGRLPDGPCTLACGVKST